MPGAIIHRVGPKLAPPGPASAGVEHGQMRLVAEDPCLSMGDLQLAVVEGAQPPGQTLQPQPQRRAVEVKTLRGHHLHLAIKRQVPGELRDRYVER